MARDTFQLARISILALNLLFILLGCLQQSLNTSRPEYLTKIIKLTYFTSICTNKATHFDIDSFGSKLVISSISGILMALHRIENSVDLDLNSYHTNISKGKNINHFIEVHEQISRM